MPKLSLVGSGAVVLLVVGTVAGLAWSQPHASAPAAPPANRLGVAPPGAATARGAFGKTICEGYAQTMYNCQTSDAASCRVDLVVPCFPYQCAADKRMCAVSCSTDANCAPGTFCDPAKSQCAPMGATCDDAWTILVSSGQLVPCAPYRCKAGACQAHCKGNADCDTGTHCQASTQLCVP